jgi:hypothetical protein
MRIVQVFILLFISGCINAQEIQFSASASPNVLEVGDQFNLTYTSNQELSGLDLPDVKDFDMLGGPSVGTNQSVYSVNGKITTSSTYQYTYFLRASKEGKFTIPPASMKFKNKIYKSNAVTIEVVKGNAAASSQSQRAASSASDNRQSANISSDDLFVKLILDKDEAYLGEQIMVTVKIFTKANLSQIDQQFKGPDFTGFFTEPIDIPPLRNLQRESYDGQVYNTGVLRKMVIIPQKTGEITIQPFEVDGAIRREIRRKVSDPFFDDFVMPSVQEIPVKLKSKAVKVLVKALPANAPASFKGAVGSFRITSSLNKTTTAVNDPLTYKLTISGKGNIKLVNELQTNVPYDMEQYDPVINTHLDNPLSGSKTFEYLLMPRVAGKYTLPAVEFTYFDVSAKQYKTVYTQSYDVTVEKGNGDTLMSVTPGVMKEDVKLLNQDIRYIKTKPFRVHYVNSFIAHSPWFYLLYLIALLIFFVILFTRRLMIKQNADIAGLRLRKADKFAKKRLKKSESLLKQGKDGEFFEELSGAIWGYLSDKLNIPVAVLSKDTAVTALQNREVPQELIDQLFEITSACEIARYAQSSGEVAKGHLYKRALDTISILQQKLR